nr:hypothetical protein [Candidatus Prometheoarchaeum syntrophicum]
MQIYFQTFTLLFSRIGGTLSEEKQAVLIPPTFSEWVLKMSGGPIIFIFSILYLVVILIEKKKHLESKIRFLNFLYFYMIFLIIICIFNPTWALISTLPYNYYRYFIYIELFMLIIAPQSIYYFFNMLRNFDFKRKNSWRKIKNYTMILIIFQILTISIFHFSNNYNFNYYNTFTRENRIKACEWLRDNTEEDSIYLIIPNRQIVWEHRYFRAILYDRHIVNYNDYYYTFGNQDKNSTDFLDNFKSFLINGTKFLISTGITLIENSSMTTDSINYLMLDSISDYHLYSILLNDTDFTMIQSFPTVETLNRNFDDRLYIYFNITIFAFREKLAL